MTVALVQPVARSDTDESSIKVSILNHLRDAGIIDQHSLLSSEFVFDGAVRRADLAILSGDQFIGIEIKSDRDTLRRLEGQIDSYARVFDRTLLVVAARHLDAVLSLKLFGAEIFCVDGSGRITEFQAPQLEAVSRPDPHSLIKMLPFSSLKKLAPVSAKRPSRNELVNCVSELPFTVIRRSLEDHFRLRFTGTSVAFWRATRSRPITAKHLGSLSRFAKKRAALDKAQRENEKFWRDWVKSAQSLIGTPE